MHFPAQGFPQGALGFLNKTTMKKIAKIIVACLCLTALMCFSSCKKNEKRILGEWELNTLVVGDNTIPVNFLGTLHITFKESGSYIIDFDANPMAELLLSGLLNGVVGGDDPTGGMFDMGDLIGLLTNQLDGMTGTYVIDKERFSMTFFIANISGDILTLDKKNFSFSATLGNSPSTFSFTKI